jgi:peptidyl-prolyl cis-trans isomerase A (cyclophilin A)
LRRPRAAFNLSAMIRPFAALPLALLIVGCGGGVAEDIPAQAVNTANAVEAPEAMTNAVQDEPPVPDRVRVRLETTAGTIVLELDGARAPVTTANFLNYVEEGRFDQATFYRAAARPGERASGFIQGGIRRSYRRMRPPIAHEPTNETGLRHEAGTISMARNEPGMAMGDFFITTIRMENLDAQGDRPGFAAFGRVVAGMDVVRAILAMPTDPQAGSGAMRGQMLADPVTITAAQRIAED